MNRLLVAVALVIGVSGPVFSQETVVRAGPQERVEEPAATVSPEEQSTANGGVSIKVDLDSREQASSAPEPASAGKRPLSENEAKERIRSKILKIVETALDSTDIEISEEVEDEIEREIESEVKDGLVVDMGHFDDTALGGLMVGALAIVVIFGTPMMIVAAVLYASYRKRRLVHDTINQYLASGKEVPPEIIKHLQTPETPKNYLQKGLVWTGVGLGIILCFIVLGETAGAAIGFIPLFVGLAQLLIWKMEQRGTGAQE